MTGPLRRLAQHGLRRRQISIMLASGAIGPNSIERTSLRNNAGSDELMRVSLCEPPIGSSTQSAPARWDP